MCKYRQKCAYYNRSTKTSSEQLLVMFYCHQHAERCEIYKRLEAGKSIPEGMDPNGIV
jgi:hypothetical protein